MAKKEKIPCYFPKEALNLPCNRNEAKYLDETTHLASATATTADGPCPGKHYIMRQGQQATPRHHRMGL